MYKTLKRVMKINANKITEIMNKIDKSPYNKILFDGAWGIGKTKHIKDSIKGNENIHYISLFGKSDINDFYQELYYLLVSKSKAKLNQVFQNLEGLSISQFGFNITIPFINDIIKSIKKELKNETNITIVIDDLERKNDSFKIKELFGFVDSVTSFNQVKVVLISSSENLSEDSIQIFENYLEKSIDRKYRINNYSKYAPKNILGINIWEAIQDVFSIKQTSNLRTLEKTKLFIEEIMIELPPDKFTNKFNKEDIYRICYAVVYFIVENKSEIIFSSQENVTEASSRVYAKKENHHDYIWHYILKRKLSNSMMNNFIKIILDWYLTGGYSKEKINKEINYINTYKATTIPLCMSIDQAEKEINEFDLYIKETTQPNSNKDVLRRLDALASISEKTNIKIGYTTNDVVNWIKNNEEFDVDSDFYNPFGDKSKFVREIREKLQEISTSENIKHTINSVAINIEKQNFKDVDFENIDKLNNLIFTIAKNDKLLNMLKSSLESNQYFLPFPLGGITNSHWSYCHQVFKMLLYINDKIEDNSILQKSKNYFLKEIDKSTDMMFKYRMNILIDFYL